MTDAVAVLERPTGAQLAEQVVIKGDLSKLTEPERMQYYSAVCDSLGLNPLTRPFEYINLNGKLTLYATRAAADQLRAIKGITITDLVPRQVGELYVVTATGRDKTGREDSSTGAVAINGLRGDPLANAMMKAETKAKRRLTLSLAGLGMTDETEIDSIADAVKVEQPAALSLAEKAAQRRAEIEAPKDQAATTTAKPTTPTTPAVTEADEPAAGARAADQPIPESATQERCSSTSPIDGEQCGHFAGHDGIHRTRNQTWPVAKGGN